MVLGKVKWHRVGMGGDSSAKSVPNAFNSFFQCLHLYCYIRLKVNEQSRIGSHLEGKRSARDEQTSAENGDDGVCHDRIRNPIVGRAGHSGLVVGGKHGLDAQRGQTRRKRFYNEPKTT